MTEEGKRQRIDKWLFFARIAKSRTLGGKLAAAGKVRVNRKKIDQASHQIQVGDVLTIALQRRIVVLRITGTGERRGPASEARLLYEDLSPPPQKPDPAEPQPSVPMRAPGAGRPTKKERRAIEKQRRE